MLARRHPPALCIYQRGNTQRTDTGRLKRDDWDAVLEE